MTFVLAIIALAFSCVQGVLLLRILEGKHPVLFRLERVCWGFLLGCALSAYVLFWMFFVGIPISFAGCLVVQIILLVVLLMIYSLQRRGGLIESSPRMSSETLRGLINSLPKWGKFIVAWIVVWTAVKVVLGGYDLLVTPTYYNDTYVNWNMRTKVFYENQSLMLDREVTDEFYFGGRVPSYPLTVYFTKLWMVFAVGEWSESTVNSIHFLWFLALIGVMYFALRREKNLLMSIIGVFILVSLPLVLIHGVNAYADVLMAAHIFCVLYAFYRWVIEKGDARRSWLLIFGVMTAAMIFVKNEALVIFFPPLAFIFFALCERWKMRRDFIKWIGIVATVAVPWTLFKFTHGLTFGNASKVSGISLTPHEGVAHAIGGDLMYTGSYLLFFPLFVLLLMMTIKFWRKHAIGLVIAYLLIVFIGEFLMYWLTPLATEAIRHTGFGRGMVHLLPAGVFVSVILLRSLFEGLGLASQHTNKLHQP